MNFQMDAPDAQHRWGLAEQAAGFGVWDLDLPSQRVLYSPQWKRLLGYAAEDCADPVATWRARVHPDDLGPMVQALSTHIGGAEPCYEHEFRLRDAEGVYRRVLSRGQVVSRDAQGVAIRAVGTMTDLTRRRSASSPPQAAASDHDGASCEQQQQQFWQRVSHELRTPLNAVLGFAQLLATRLGPDDLPTQRLYLSHVEKAGWQLLKLVETAMAEGGALSPVPLYTAPGELPAAHGEAGHPKP